MRVPELMRKQFEAEYLHNAKLRACAWCVIYHCYKVKPSFAHKFAPEASEKAVADILSSFMRRKAREAYEALHPLPDGVVWNPDSGYVMPDASIRPQDWIERAELLDLDLESFIGGYVEMFESMYDEEVAQ